MIEFNGNKYQNIWFTSDLHFGHVNILKFCPRTRPFQNIMEADEALIRYHNNVVSPFDLTIILGDFSFAHPARTKSILRAMSGSKAIVLGNHDRKSLKSGAFSDVDWVDKEFSDMIGEHWFHMYHFPVWEWDRMHRGAFHLHGHVHGKETGIPGRIMDVGWDAHGRYLNYEDVVSKLIEIEVRKH